MCYRHLWYPPHFKKKKKKKNHRLFTSYKRRKQLPFQKKRRGGFWINCHSKYPSYDNFALQPSDFHRIAVINDTKLLGASSPKTPYGCCLCLPLKPYNFPSLLSVGNKSVNAHLCTQARILLIVHSKTHWCTPHTGWKLRITDSAGKCQPDLMTCTHRCTGAHQGKWSVRTLVCVDAFSE